MRGLIGRLLPGRIDEFILETIPPSAQARDVFEIHAREGKVVLRGNNGVALASALNWYLKYHCNAQVSWCGDQLNLPAKLPLPTVQERRETPYPWRYMFNYVTFGYTMPFWDWDRWEREIDWMALNGINMPLAATGAEVVQRNVFKGLGLSDGEVGAFIAGPAYLPWFLMGNIDGWGGPLPETWYRQQEELQKRIVARQREFGMKPVLPAFGGHVPPALKRLHPEAQIRLMPPWAMLPPVSVLDPGDPLFRKIGAAFVQEATRLYGTDHIYSADTFNEVDPPTTDLAFLEGMARNVYKSMADADPDAVWLMQGWLFLSEFWQDQTRIDALLNGVPDDRMIVLDLFASAKPQWERTNAFSGKQWIWSAIHNWGGKQGMYARMQQAGQVLPATLKDPAAGKLVGLGTASEGIEINPVFFDLMYEMTWRDEPVELGSWMRDFVRRRYGADNEKAQAAWAILLEQVYTCADKRHGPQGSLFAMRPTLAKGGAGFVRAELFYDTAKVREAFIFLLDAAHELGHLETYRHDLVDLGRQVMSDRSHDLHEDIRHAQAGGDLMAFDRAADRWFEAMDDLDALLSSNRMFLLGRWIQWARDRALNEEEAKLFEWNARNLITLWGPRDARLADYAQRQYGGFTRDFQKPRWALFFDMVRRSMEAKQEWDQGTFWEPVRDLELKWTHERKNYPTTPQGDPIALAREIAKKYCTPAAAEDLQANRHDFVGRWEYAAGGKTFVRELAADGSLASFVDGVPQANGQGNRWVWNAGTVECRRADGSVFERHRVDAAGRLVFLTSGAGPARREISHKE